MSIDGKIIALGTLNTEKIPQQSFDLVFNKTFELFHNWKNGNVFFHGYTAINDTSSLYPFLYTFFNLFASFPSSNVACIHLRVVVDDLSLT